jgi:hypothetical protein
MKVPPLGKPSTDAAVLVATAMVMAATLAGAG